LVRNGKSMQLSIVISKEGAGEARITSHSCLVDLVHFLNLMGVNNWNMYDKGPARLESNGPDLYVAIGPLIPQDLKIFLKQAKSFLEK